MNKKEQTLSTLGTLSTLVTELMFGVPKVKDIST